MPEVPGTPGVDKGKTLEQACGVSSPDQNTVDQDEVQLDDPLQAPDVDLEENTPALGLQGLLGKVGNCTEPEGWRMERAADLVGHLPLGTAHSLEQKNSSVHNWEYSRALRDRNARKPCYIVVEAHGQRPAAIPRWSPRFLTMSVNAVCAPLEWDAGVRVRSSADDESVAASLPQVVALQRSVCDDSRCAALMQSLKDLSHPGKLPSSLRFRLNIGGYHPRMRVRRVQVIRERQKSLRRRLWKRIRPN